MSLCTTSWKLTISEIIGAWSTNCAWVLHRRQAGPFIQMAGSWNLGAGRLVLKWIACSNPCSLSDLPTADLSNHQSGTNQSDQSTNNSLGNCLVKQVQCRSKNWYLHVSVWWTTTQELQKSCINEKLEEKAKFSNQLMSFVEFISGCSKYGSLGSFVNV